MVESLGVIRVRGGHEDRVPVAELMSRLEATSEQGSSPLSFLSFPLSLPSCLLFFLPPCPTDIQHAQRSHMNMQPPTGRQERPHVGTHLTSVLLLDSSALRPVMNRCAVRAMWLMVCCSSQGSLRWPCFACPAFVRALDENSWLGLWPAFPSHDLGEVTAAPVPHL